MKKQFTFAYDEDPKDSLSFECSPAEDERLASSMENGVPFILLNPSGMITLAKILIKMANGSYSNGFHVHLRRDFNADLPDCVVIMLSSKDATHQPE